MGINVVYIIIIHWEGSRRCAPIALSVKDAAATGAVAIAPRLARDKMPADKLLSSVFMK